MSDVYLDDELEVEPIEPVFTAASGGGLGRLQKAAVRQAAHEFLDESEIARIGADVVTDWNRDQAANKDWREKAEAALDAAAQEKVEPKNYPFRGAANVKYPLLTISSTGFNARAAPAVIKGDQAIHVKTFGKDKKGTKAKRAARVGEYLNYLLFYKVKGWVHDTDAMLIRLPAVGQHYRKVWWDPLTRQTCIESVSALRLTLAEGASSMASSPRITHDYDRYPHELQKLMASGHFRKVNLVPEGDDDQKSRVLLEQYRYMDLDDDGLDEPYIVTVDASTTEVLRIDNGWDDEAVERDQDGTVLNIERELPFVDYGFIPDPKGRAYAIGFGHLLTPIMDVINTIINLSIDAGHAQVAGGGFFGSEIRLQGAGQNGAARWQPGEYKNLPVSGDDIRKGIYERIFPGPSDVLFQFLGMLMEAAERIASVNDAMTGDANRNAPVGTTLALIEQGQQVFNAIYKRLFEGLRNEFTLFANIVAKHGDAADYAKFCDEAEDAPETGQMGHNGGPPMAPEGAQAPMMGQQAQPGLMGAPGAPVAPPMAPPVDPEALFKADFDFDDLDIRPISDPSAVTRAQLLAKFQIALQFVGKGVYADDNAVIRYGLEAAGIGEASDWIPEKTGPSPQEQMMMKLQMALAEAELAIKQGQAAQFAANAQKTQASVQIDGAKAQADIQHKGAQTAQIVDGLDGQQALERARQAQSELANDEVDRRKGLNEAAMALLQPGLEAEREERAAAREPAQ